MINRRSFLQSAPLLAIAPSVPLFITRTAVQAGEAKDARILVVLQLDGGNDGLNTLVPLKNDAYRKLRPKLAIADKDTLKFNDEFGLHAQMRPLEKMIAAGQMTAAVGIGYPNPSRSHFESMAVWHSAKRDPEDHRSYGWLGRALDRMGGDSYLIGDEIPLALRGRRSATVTMQRLEDLIQTHPGPKVSASASDDLLAYVARHSLEATQAAERLEQITRQKLDLRYPQNALGNRLQLIARLIKGDLGTRVFYTQQGGYDTHSMQQFTHAGLLNDFAASVAAFFQDLTQSKLAERVVLFAFSEFGRTIRENGSGGTDHGTAGVSFLFGPQAKGGVVGKLPAFDQLKEGEPIPTGDFRSLYANLLQNWMHIDSSVLDGKYEPLQLLR